MANLLKFVKLSEKATTPTKGSKYSAGYDLYSSENKIIKSNSRDVVSTDLQISLPLGTYGRIAPRSGLAVKHFIHVGAGVIDEDYRGTIMVVLFNHSNVDFAVNIGDRVAQLICERIIQPELMEVSKLDETDRNDKGFGSTGIL
jgi:dUTP pyrophosphatase